MGGVVLRSRLAPRTAVPSARTGPDLGLLDSVRAGFDAAVDSDDGMADARRREALDDGFQDLVAGLEQAGMPGSYTSRPLSSAFALTYNEEAIWQAAQAVPALAKTLPKTLDDYRAQLTAPVDRAITDRAQRATQASGAGSLIGQFGYGATDPVNVATLGIGGVGAGKTILQTAVREAALNMRIELAQQPSRIVERGLRGKETTPGEVALDVGGAAIAGAVFGGIGKAFDLHGGAAVGRVADGWEAGLAAVWPRLPEAVRNRWRSSIDVTDADLPDLADLTIGKGNMSAEERGAAAAVRAESAVARANPFERNGAGVAAHQGELAAALARVLDNVPGSRRGLERGTALSSGSVPVQPSNAAIDRVFDSLIVQESSGVAGRAGPMTPYGQAHGLTQVLDTTGEAVARRLGIAWKPALMRAATPEGAAYQRQIGRAYFEEGLRRYGGDVRRALMFYHGGPNEAIWGPKTRGYADQVLARAGGGEVRLAMPETGLTPELAAAQAALDRARADRFEIEARRPDEPTAEVIAPVARDTDSAEVAPVVDAAPVAATLPDEVLMPSRARETKPVDALTYIARNGGLRDDEGHDLRGRGRLISGAVSGVKRRAGGGDSNLPRFAPGGGYLFKKNGLSVDAVGELLHDAGYITGNRPTEAEVLDFLDRAASSPAYLLADSARVAEIAQARANEEWLAQADQQIDDHLERYFGDHDFVPTPEERDFLRSFLGARGDLDGAIDAMAGELAGRHSDEIFGATNDPDYDIPFDYDDDPRPFAPRSDDPFDEEGVGGRAAGRGDAREIGALPADADRAPGAGRAGAGDAGELTPVDTATAAAFDDPDALAAKAQVDSLEHDLRPAVDPNIADRQRQQAQLGAAGPMRATVDQESTIGSPLFDAVDQFGLRLDEDGPETSIDDIFATLDDEAQAIEHVRGCL